TVWVRGGVVQNQLGGSHSRAMTISFVITQLGGICRHLLGLLSTKAARTQPQFTPQIRPTLSAISGFRTGCCDWACHVVVHCLRHRYGTGVLDGNERRKPPSKLIG